MTAPDTDALARFHAACGRAVRAWAGLETAFVAHLRTFLDCDEHRARIVWQSLPTPAARLGLLRALAIAYLDTTRQNQLVALIGRAEALCAMRDLLVDAAGGVDLRSGKVVLTSAAEPTTDGGPIMPGLHEMDIADIETCATEIASLEVEVVKWLRTLATALRGSPRRRS